MFRTCKSSSTTTAWFLLILVLSLCKKAYRYWLVGTVNNRRNLQAASTFKHGEERRVSRRANAQHSSATSVVAQVTNKPLRFNLSQDSLPWRVGDCFLTSPYDWRRYLHRSPGVLRTLCFEALQQRQHARPDARRGLLPMRGWNIWPGRDGFWGMGRLHPVCSSMWVSLSVSQHLWGVSLKE
jgi:hypothetical protein